MQIRKVLTGEVLFREGANGKHLMYLIKEGRVEISIYRSDKKMVLATLGKGQFFGELDLLAKEPRSTSALALTYCELQVIDVDVLSKHFDHSPPLLRHIVRALITTVKSRNEVVAQQGNDQPVISTYAYILEMMAGSQTSRKTLRHSEKSDTTLAVNDVLEKCRKVLGHHKEQSMAILKKMAKINLLTLESGNNYQNIKFNAEDIIDRAINLPTEISQEVLAYVQSEQEHIGLDELSELVGVPRQTLLRKISLDSISEEVFLIRKSAVLRFILEKGKTYFSKMEKLPLDQILYLEDLDFISKEILLNAINNLDTIEQAKLLKSTSNVDFQNKIFSVMGRAQKEEISSIMNEIQKNTEEFAAIEEKYIYIVKKLAQPI